MSNKMTLKEKLAAISEARSVEIAEEQKKEKELKDKLLREDATEKANKWISELPWRMEKEANEGKTAYDIYFTNDELGNMVISLVSNWAEEQGLSVRTQESGGDVNLIMSWG